MHALLGILVAAVAVLDALTAGTNGIGGSPRGLTVKRYGTSGS
jgi:hypothetical protein